MNFVFKLFAIASIVLLFSCKKNDTEKGIDEKGTPIILIVSPANNNVFTIGDDITITIKANDIDGIVAKVQYIINDTLRYESQTEPYSYTWNTRNEKQGMKKIYMIVTDNEGKSKMDSLSIYVEGIDPVIKTKPMELIGTTLVIAKGDIIRPSVPLNNFNGVCWSKKPKPTPNDNHLKVTSTSGEFLATIKGLELGTTYYLRAFAQNRDTTIYGEELTFTTANTYHSDTGSIIDPNTNNRYKWVTIGSQTWLAENLKSNANYVDSVYGDYYQYGTCPVGWHIPEEDEWMELINYLGGTEVAGGFLKEPGTTHWESPNSNATNASLFNALPGGAFRLAYWGGHGDNYLEQLLVGKNSYFRINSGGYIGLDYSSEQVDPKSRIPFSGGNDYYFSNVRCVKDK